MIRRFKALYLRWKTSNNYTNDLDFILNQAEINSPLFDRLSWLVDLMQWVRYKPYLVDYQEVAEVRRPVTRLKFLLSLLDRNPYWKSRVAQMLRSILIETRDVELLAYVGLPEEMGFWSEFMDRLSSKIMPKRPVSEGGIRVLPELFPDREDFEWFASIPEDLMQKLIDLILFEKQETDSFTSMINDIQEALLILTSQVMAIGMSYQIRRRIGGRAVKELPLFDLTRETEVLLEAVDRKDRAAVTAQILKIEELISQCFGVFHEVYRHLDAYGVSLKVVYLLESGKAKLKRIRDLVHLLGDEYPRPDRLVYFISQLIEESQKRASIGSLFEQNTELISLKIVDRSAETGEHYIARTFEEYWRMFRRALGGGAVVALLVIIKVLISFLKLPDFISGFLNSVNYSTGFVWIQLKGYTLATKQPAMTGPAIASKLQRLEAGQSLDPVIDEIIKLIRTQMIGILGNLGAVIPMVIVIDVIYFLISGSHIVSTSEKAHYLINSSHILSGTALFAAFTGIWLWLSSVIAGYVDNWFVLNRMPETIRLNRKLNFVVGKENSESIAQFLEKNISGLAANISLAFFLGLIPPIMKFLGLYLDVRHVTLSAGNVTLGAMSFGLQIFKSWDFWLAAVGVLVTGVLNVGVSFALATWVALKSRRLTGSSRSEIRAALFKRFRKQPLAFILPRDNKND